MSQLRVGVIGTGMMGCEHLRNLIGIPEVTITAISDIHEQQREWAQHTLSILLKSNPKRKCEN